MHKIFGILSQQSSPMLVYSRHEKGYLIALCLNTSCYMHIIRSKRIQRSYFVRNANCIVGNSNCYLVDVQHRPYQPARMHRKYKR